MTALLLVLPMLALSRPERLGLTRGSVSLTQSSLDGARVTIIDGAPPNFLGQLQGIGLRRVGERFYVELWVMRWHPFCRFSTHREFPIVIQHSGLHAGKYEVLYWNEEDGFLSAGSFTVGGPR